MMKSLSLYAVIACSRYISASPAPAPTAAPVASKDLRPRFLREADTLPPRGIVEEGVATLPLFRARGTKRDAKVKRQSIIQVPLGDQLLDLSYGVALDIGDQPVTFQVDTGSADLWSMTSGCMTPDGNNCSNVTSIPSYTPSSSFSSLDLPLTINYGTPASPTFAEGTIGTDNVTFAGLSQSQQAFASINSTNNSIVDDFSGIFGVGLPYLSQIVDEVVNQQLGNDMSSMDGQKFLSTFSSAIDMSAPLLHRLASSGKLKEPMYTLTLQRTAPTTEGSNAGVMTLGGLPSGISNDSLTWVPVKTYPVSVSLFSGLNSSRISSTLVDKVSQILPRTPYKWEVVVDGLYINGKLQHNSSVDPNITDMPGNGLTALFDSGASLTYITGNDMQSPQLPPVDSNGILPCSTMYNISFGIAGKQFPINPFDLIEPMELNDTVNCVSGIAENTPPTNSSTNSYWVGDSFFRSNLVAFYWGNITDPASDPARIGFLSTVNDTEAESDFSSFWQSAKTASPSFTFSTEDGTPKMTTTSVANPINSNAGVAAASGGVGNGAGSISSSNSGASSFRHVCVNGAAVAVVVSSAGLALL